MPAVASGKIPRCDRCLTFWRPDANVGAVFDGYVVRDGKVYCANRRACETRLNLARTLDRLAYARAA